LKYKITMSTMKLYTGNIARLKLIEEWVEKSSSVLDLGCGDCYIISQLKQMRNLSRVLGVGVSDVALEKCRKLGIKTQNWTSILNTIKSQS